MNEVRRLEHEVVDELEKGSISITTWARAASARCSRRSASRSRSRSPAGVTTLLHERGAGPNGGIIVGGVHIHHFVFGMLGLLLLGVPLAAAVRVRGHAAAALVPPHGLRLRSLLGADPRRVRALAQPARRLLAAPGPGKRRGARDLRRRLPLGSAHLAVRRRGLAPPPRASAGAGSARGGEAEQVEAAQVSLLRWLRRQLRQPNPVREHLEAAVENDDVGRGSAPARDFEFSDEQRRNVEQCSTPGNGRDSQVERPRPL